MSLVDRPQRQQNTPPEGISLRTCPRLTIGCSSTSRESWLTIGAVAYRIHCTIVQCAFANGDKRVLNNVKVRLGNDHIRWDDSSELKTWREFMNRRRQKFQHGITDFFH